MLPKFLEPLAFYFIVLHQCAKIVAHFEEHIGYATKLICAILGVVPLLEIMLWSKVGAAFKYRTGPCKVLHHVIVALPQKTHEFPVRLTVRLHQKLQLLSAAEFRTLKQQLFAMSSCSR